jgi:excisionase family DNA binding protein
MKKNSDIDSQRYLLFDNLIWLNSREAAEYLRITVDNLRLKVHRGQLKPRYLNGRLRFKRSELDDLLESSIYGGFK